MFVIGTAGHIDHGKSSIIIRLTGVDPDRLPEEKERGMTIDLGFAAYDTLDGKRIGIVDVPGHERFVRNMIAGTGGIDAVMLVIAADDGWMPQSQEHLQITKLLDIRYGIVVISKIDMVDQSWVDLVEEDIKEKLKGTFLEKSAIVRLSSVTGEGFDGLTREIENLAGRIIEREDIGKPRLYVDRSFIIVGMGGIVTGTLRGGEFITGQSVAVYPSRHKGKIRTIQSHNQKVEKACPGQRTSISLTGIDKEFLKRGSVISSTELIENYPDDIVFALSMELLNESPVVIQNRRRLLMIVGTTEIEGEVRVYGQKTISCGSNGIIFFKPYEPVLAFIGDRYIVRLPTPAVTIGGGAVLDILNRFPGKKELAEYNYLEKRIALSAEKLVATESEKQLSFNPKIDFNFSVYSRDVTDAIVKQGISNSMLVEYAGRYYRSDDIENVSHSVVAALEKYFQTSPHMDGLPVDRIARLTQLRISSLEPIIQMMADKNQLVRKQNRYDLPGREIKVKGNLKTAANMIERMLLDGNYSPPLIKELIGDDKVKKEAFEYLLLSGKITKIGGNLTFHSTHWRAILSYVREIINDNTTLTVGSLREKLDSSRKYVVPILEETDRLQFTKRQGDIRVRGVKFEEI